MPSPTQNARRNRAAIRNRNAVKKSAAKAKPATVARAVADALAGKGKPRLVGPTADSSYRSPARQRTRGPSRMMGGNKPLVVHSEGGTPQTSKPRERVVGGHREPSSRTTGRARDITQRVAKASARGAARGKVGAAAIAGAMLAGGKELSDAIYGEPKAKGSPGQMGRVSKPEARQAPSHKNYAPAAVAPAAPSQKSFETFRKSDYTPAKKPPTRTVQANPTVAPSAPTPKKTQGAPVREVDLSGLKKAKKKKAQSTSGFGTLDWGDGSIIQYQYGKKK